jgi:3-oxoacyl-[acyl-carrier-protein] synthase III
MSHPTSLFGIEAASHYLPPRKPVADWVRQQGLPGEILAQLHENGMMHFHQAGDATVEALAHGAMQALLEDHPVDPLSVDLLVFVHSLPTSTPPAPASLPTRLATAFGLRRARSFALSGQNCASLLAALRLMRSLFHADPALHRVLLVSADRACGEHYRNLGAFSFESDGASALLASRHHPYNRALAFAGHVDGRHHAGFRRPQARAHEYRALYGLVAHRLLSRTAQASGLRLADFRHLLPINVDRHVFERVARSLHMPPHWVFTPNVAQHGHVMCSDVVINLTDLLRHSPIDGNANLLFFMSGNNGSFATMALGNCHSFQQGRSLGV